jgi:hypothetical protein
MEVLEIGDRSERTLFAALFPRMSRDFGLSLVHPFKHICAGSQGRELGRFRGLSLVAGLLKGRLESGSNGRDES